jgi:PAS domain S-box-containing protein
MTDRTDRHGLLPESAGIDLSRFLDSIPDGCFALAADWTVTYLNRACEEYVGRDRAELLGHSVWDSHPALRGTECERHLREAMAARTARRIELESALHPGNLVELRIFPMRGGLAVVLRDVTAERRREEALRESEARFRNLADNAPVMIWVTEADGSCIYASRRWYEFTGQTPETALGFGWLHMLHPDDRAEAERISLEAKARRVAFRCDYRVRRQDGEWRWAIADGAPRFGDDGSFLGYVGSVIDITERKQAEERLKLLAREVDHRAKNILALVQVVIRQTRAASVDEFVKVVSGRLYALGRAHTLLSQARWKGADLHRLVQEELAMFRVGSAGRVRLSGPAVSLGPEAAQSLAMTIHELVTNAMKHGALSVPEGVVDLDWTGGGDAPLVLRWAESGGPPVRRPTRVGVGLDVVSKIAGEQLGGGARFDWRPAGLVCDVVVPADKLVRASP